MSSIMMVGVSLAVVAVLILGALLGRRSGARLATASVGANTNTNANCRPNDKPATQIGSVFASAGFGGDLPNLGGIKRESVGDESLMGVQFTPDGGYVVRRKNTRSFMPSDNVVDTRAPIFLVGGGGVRQIGEGQIVVDRGTRREPSDDDKEGHIATPGKHARGTTGGKSDQTDGRPDPDRGRPAKDDPPVKKEPDVITAPTKPSVSTAEIAISGLPRGATAQDIRTMIEGTDAVVKGIRVSKGGEATVTIEGNEGFTRSVARKISGQQVNGAEITARLASDTASTKPTIVGSFKSGVAAAMRLAHPPKAASDEDAEAAKSALPEGRTVRIGNLPYEVTQSDLEAMFDVARGKPDQVIMPRRTDGFNRGYAWATYENAETATAAVDALKGTKWVDTELEIGLRKPMFVLPTTKPDAAAKAAGTPATDPLADYTIAGAPPAKDAAVASAAKKSKKGKTK